MIQYPEEITQKYLESIKDVLDEQIIKDIADTEKEMIDDQAKSSAYRDLSKASSGIGERRLFAFKCGGFSLRAQDKAEFIFFLKKILLARKEGN